MGKLMESESSLFTRDDPNNESDHRDCLFPVPCGFRAFTGTRNATNTIELERQTANSDYKPHRNQRDLNIYGHTREGRPRASFIPDPAARHDSALRLLAAAGRRPFTGV
jgi:hypothetical protein